MPAAYQELVRNVLVIVTDLIFLNRRFMNKIVIGLASVDCDKNDELVSVGPVVLTRKNKKGQVVQQYELPLLELEIRDGETASSVLSKHLSSIIDVVNKL